MSETDSIVGRLLDSINEAKVEGQEVVRIVLFGDAWAELHADPAVLNLLWVDGLEPRKFAGIPIASAKPTPDGPGFKLELKA